MGPIDIAIILFCVAVVGGVIAGKIIAKKKGKSGCGCGCTDCSKCPSVCQRKEQEKTDE